MSFSVNLKNLERQKQIAEDELRELYYSLDAIKQMRSAANNDIALQALLPEINAQINRIESHTAWVRSRIQFFERTREAVLSLIDYEDEIINETSQILSMYDSIAF